MRQTELKVTLAVVSFIVVLLVQSQFLYGDVVLSKFSANSGGSVSNAAGASSGLTIGQPVIGQSSQLQHRALLGYWPQWIQPGCDDCGDANSDGAIDISDAVFLISHIFTGGPAPGDCNYPKGMGDANGDQTVDISDAVYLISRIFSGGAAPHCYGMP